LRKARTPGLRVCVADDDPAIRLVLASSLEHLGHRVEPCRNGDEVLEKALPGAFDLLLIDLEMEGPGGIEVLSTLHRRAVETPAILMSSRFPAESWSAGFKYANVSLLLKPFSLETLERAISDHRSYPGRTFR